MLRNRERRRQGISAAAVLAAVIILTAGVTAVYLYPSLAGAGNGQTSATSTIFSGGVASTTSSRANTTTVTALSNFTVSYFTTSYSTTTFTAGGWQEWAVLNATLGYYKTQWYIHNAWNYTFNVQQTGSSPVLVSDIIEVIGPLSVSGNWTTQYNLNYTRISELNVTVQYSPPSNYYPVIGFSSHNSTGINETIQFNSTQQKAISTAVANGTVKAFMGQSPTFVDAAWLFPAGNKTFGGDYVVEIFQVNGPKTLVAFVNTSTNQVVSTYNSTRAIRVCFSNGPCFSSPWGS